MIRTALIVSWFWAALLTCAPLFGVGLYYDESKNLCTRYRYATEPKDFVYAIFYVIFGELKIFLPIISIKVLEHSASINTCYLLPIYNVYKLKLKLPKLDDKTGISIGYKFLHKVFLWSSFVSCEKILNNCII